MRSYSRAALMALLATLAVMFGLSSPAAAHNDAAYAVWARGADFAWDKPSAQQLLNYGAKYAMVYISPTKNSGKHASPAQVATYRSNGIQIGLIYETTASRALGGCDAGVTDGQRVNAALDRFGLPRSTVVYSGAIDFDVQPRQLGTIQRYLDCQSDLRGGRERVGVYGSYRAIENAASWGYTYNWQTYAWSGGKWSNSADLRQVHNGWRIDGLDTDMNYTSNMSQVGFIGYTQTSPGSPQNPNSAAQNPGTSDNPWANAPVVRPGDRGANVRAAQGALYDRGWKISVDGSFGPSTTRIVKAFQREKGLTVDGIVGPATWKCLYTSPR